MKISTTIDKLSLSSTLNVTSLSTEGTLIKPYGSSTVTTIPYGVGILSSTSDTATPAYLALSGTNAFKEIAYLNHVVSTGYTYDVTVTSAETYPFITFEFYMQKVVSTGPAYPTMRFNSDSGSTYDRRLIHTAGGSALTVLNDTQTGIHLAEVNSEVATSNANTSYSVGSAWLKSGLMRSVQLESQQSQSGSMGYVTQHIKWSNTASTITSINIAVPNNVYLYGRIYQQIG